MLLLETVFWEVMPFGLHFRNVLNTTYVYSYNFRNSVSKSNTVFVLVLETVFSLRNSVSKSNTVFVLLLETVFWKVTPVGLTFGDVLNTTYHSSYSFRNSVSKSNTVFVLVVETVF